MNTFANYIKKHKLEAYSEQNGGTFYTDTDANPEIIIHHFNGNISPEYIGTYTEIFQDLKKWISERPSLEKLIIVEQLLETGDDYIKFPFHIDHLVLCVLDEFPDVVDHLKHMQDMVQSELGSPKSKKEEYIEEVARRSLLTDAAYTIFDDYLEKFIIIEPQVDNQILEEYAELV